MIFCLFRFWHSCQQSIFTIVNLMHLLINETIYVESTKLFLSRFSMKWPNKKVIMRRSKVKTNTKLKEGSKSWAANFCYIDTYNFFNLNFPVAKGFRMLSEISISFEKRKLMRSPLSTGFAIFFVSRSLKQ